MPARGSSSSRPAFSPLLAATVAQVRRLASVRLHRKPEEPVEARAGRAPAELGAGTADWGASGARARPPPAITTVPPTLRSMDHPAPVEIAALIPTPSARVFALKAKTPGANGT